MSNRSRTTWSLENAVLELESVQGEVVRQILARIAAGIPNAKILDLDAGKITTGFLSVERIAPNSITLREQTLSSYDNLLLNPGFEVDVIDGALDPHAYAAGSGGTWSTATGAPRSGGQAARFDVDTQSGSAQLRFNGALTDPDLHVSATEGDEHYFGLWARWVDNAPTVDATIRIRYYDEAGVQVGSDASTTLSLTGAYQYFEVRHTAPAGTAYVTFIASIPSGNASNVGFLFDDGYARRAVGSVLFEANIQSDNFVADTSGWRIQRDTGNAEFNDVKVRGTIVGSGNTATVAGTLDVTGSVSLGGAGSFQTDAAGQDRIEMSGTGTPQIQFYEGATERGTIYSDPTSDDLWVRGKGTSAVQLMTETGTDIARFTRSSDVGFTAMEVESDGAQGILRLYGDLLLEKPDGRIATNYGTTDTEIQMNFDGANDFWRLQLDDSGGTLQNRILVYSGKHASSGDIILYNAAGTIALRWDNSAANFRFVDGVVDQVEVPDGTEAAPGLAFDADSGNGIRRVGTDEWALVANGVDQVLIGTYGMKIDTSLDILPRSDSSSDLGSTTLRFANLWVDAVTITNDGTGSGIDADTVDGSHASAFATSGHDHQVGSTVGTPDVIYNSTGLWDKDSSSVRIKKNIAPLSQNWVGYRKFIPAERRGEFVQLPSVLDLTPATFTIDTEAKNVHGDPEQLLVGLIAEEVKKKYPPAFVKAKGKDDYPNWDVKVIVAALLDEVKKMRRELDLLLEEQ